MKLETKKITRNPKSDKDPKFDGTQNLIGIQKPLKNIENPLKNILKTIKNQMKNH